MEQSRQMASSWIIPPVFVIGRKVQVHDHVAIQVIQSRFKQAWT